MTVYYKTPEATVSAYKGAAVTPSDTTQLEVTRGLYIGGAGNLVVTMADGNNVTFANHPVGYAPIQVTKVLSTGTTATSIVALY